MISNMNIDIYGNFLDPRSPFLHIIRRLVVTEGLHINIMGPVHSSLARFAQKKYQPADIALGFGSPEEIKGMHMGDYKLKLGYSAWETTCVPYGSYYGQREVFEQLDALIVPTNWQKQQFAHLKKPIYDIPLPMSPGIRKIHRQKHDVFTFIIEGTLTLKHNVGYILSAFLQLNRKYPDTRLIIKTESGTMGHIRLPEESVTIIDKAISNEEYFTIMEMADCLVYPVSADAYPVSMINAIGTGLPAILPSHSGFDSGNMLKKHELIDAERYSKKYGDVGYYWSIDPQELYEAMESAYHGKATAYNPWLKHTLDYFVNDIINLIRNLYASNTRNT